MSKFEIVMPKMGERMQPATIHEWYVKEGDTIEKAGTLLEITTDGLNTGIPSPVNGIVKKIRCKKGSRVAEGEVIAEVDMQAGYKASAKKDTNKNQKEISQSVTESLSGKGGNRFYSPLVRNIARKENITPEELETIKGSGINGRVRKEDMLMYLENRQKQDSVSHRSAAPDKAKKPNAAASVNAVDEIIEMDRTRQITADKMVMSKQVSPHVTAMVEADVSSIVEWRNKLKDHFLQQEGYKMSYLPVFIDATARALRDFPSVNASVDGSRIILRKDVNIGIAVVLPDGNRVVPVIRQVDHRNLLGINREMNRLVQAARNYKLSPDDTADGTFSITNYGSFRNLMGTPIINQPQVAILATGTIEKKPSILETSSGDVIAIRSKMFLSLSYDHRVVDDAMGGAFIRQVADYLEAFAKNQNI